MIVVVGHPALRAGMPPSAAGRAAEIAVEAARRGSRVELIGACGDDPEGDVLLIALSAAGVGHAATLRDAARRTPVLAAGAASVPDDDEDDFHAGLGTASILADEPATDDRPDAAGPWRGPAAVARGVADQTPVEVLVVTDDVSTAALPAAVEGAAWSGAHLVLLLSEGAPVPAGIPTASTALAAPGAADEGTFGRLVGAYAAGLDAGASPAEAFAAATRAAGWEALATGA